MFRFVPIVSKKRTIYITRSAALPPPPGLAPRQRACRRYWVNRARVTSRARWFVTGARACCRGGSWMPPVGRVCARHQSGAGCSARGMSGGFLSLSVGYLSDQQRQPMCCDHIETDFLSFLSPSVHDGGRDITRVGVNGRGAPTRRKQKRRSGVPERRFGKPVPSCQAASLSATPFSLNSWCSSPVLYISRTMSQPPMNSPFT